MVLGQAHQIPKEPTGVPFHNGKKIAVHYGAGNIGRGFIGPLLVNAHHHVVFADVQSSIVDALNSAGEYEVHILDHKKRRESISDVSGVMSTKPELVEIFLQADLVTTSVGPEVLKKIAPTIAQGLTRRHEAGRGILNIIACENLVGATSQLREHVELCLDGNEAVLAYIQDTVGFADCSVDRIVPPFNGSNTLDVGVEEFYEWVVDKTALKGPPLEIKGMKLSGNLSAYIERKLFTLNTGHAMLAFLGSIKGYKTIDESIKDEELRNIVLEAMRESGAALVKKHGFDPQEHEKYVQKTLTRFANPNIHDDLLRVSRKPLRKLGEGDRLIGPIKMAKEYGLSRSNLLKGVAAAFLHDNPEDEESVELNKILKEKGIEKAVVELTSFPEGSEEYNAVLKEYEELKTWTKS